MKGVHFLWLLSALWLHIGSLAALEILGVQGSDSDRGGLDEAHGGCQISEELFNSLEELSRLVDIAYCVGTTGIYKPFHCAGRCHEFKDLELVKTFNTGLLMSDSCGYIALSHSPSHKRIIVAFRGTYSITNAIVDLSVAPQAYVPYSNDNSPPDGGCDNCTVHEGFMTSWDNARSEILPPLSDAIKQYPDYQLVVTGHSLGGAVAALASIEFKLRGWNPHVTTFGEPRIGNQALVDYIDEKFDLLTSPVAHNRLGSRIRQGPRLVTDPYPLYRRITHVRDPVPLLPSLDLNYRSHGGEIFISKVDVPPSINDIHVCYGDADPTCAAQAEDNTEEVRTISQSFSRPVDASNAQNPLGTETYSRDHKFSITPRSLDLWEIFFAHRDYFWRVGICLPHFTGPTPNGKCQEPWWSRLKWKWPWEKEI